MKRQGKMTIKSIPMFAQNSIERMDNLRSSADAIWKNSEKLIKSILIFNGHIVLNKSDNSCFFSHACLSKLASGNDLRIFLGGFEQEYYFAISIENAPSHLYEMIDVRTFSKQNLLPDQNMGLIAQAISTLSWHASHRFCPNCGSLTEPAYSGWRRDCPSCSKQHFPRIDPVIIMLVTQGDCCLLGAGQNFTEQRYSCLAGFMEPGETIEDAAKRELFEEVGIKSEKVNYVVSQPWPFPSSLMIGVHIQVSDTQIILDTKELRDAMWVKKSEVSAVLKGAADYDFSLPPRIAIAHTLLEYWVAL